MMSFNIVIISKPIKSIQDGFNPNQSCFFFPDVSSVKTLYGFVFREFTLLPIVLFFLLLLLYKSKSIIDKSFFGRKNWKVGKRGEGLLNSLTIKVLLLSLFQQLGIEKGGQVKEVCFVKFLN